MKQLATSHVDLDVGARPKAFISSAADFNQNHADFDGGFLIWCDTENMLTKARLSPGSPLSTVAQLSTAFSILGQVPDDHRSDTFEPVINACENIAWQFIRRMMRDMDPLKGCPTPITFINTDTIEVERDGPYYNNYFGVTVRLTIQLKDAVPKYEPARWAS